MGKSINLHDSMKPIDFLSHRKSGPFVRTKITAGYDPYIDSKTGVTKFGTQVFETENMIVLGGSLFTLEKVFDVNYFNGSDNTFADELNLDTLFGFTSASSSDYTLSDASDFPQKTNSVCLFGVSTYGAGESITDVKSVNYYERALHEGGSGSSYGLLPFKLLSSSERLTEDEKERYWYRNELNVGGNTKTAYYLKSFETDPEVFVLYRDNGDDDGSPVKSSPWSEKPETPIETFIQLTLRITKDDIRQYFIDNGEIEKTRINSIALFSAIPATVTKNGNTYTDYRNVRMFSRLNINNEMLTTNKDLTISYRIYTS